MEKELKGVRVNRKERRNKKKELQEQQQQQQGGCADDDRCNYFVAHKNRQCKLRKKQGQEYCGMHADSQLQVVRVPCPLCTTPVLPSTYEKHLNICPVAVRVKQVANLPCYQKDINGSIERDEHFAAERFLSLELNPSENLAYLGNLIERIHAAWKQLVDSPGGGAGKPRNPMDDDSGGGGGGGGDDNSDNGMFWRRGQVEQLLPPRCAERIADSGDRRKRHLIQQASLLGHMYRRNLLDGLSSSSSCLTCSQSLKQGTCLEDKKDKDNHHHDGEKEKEERERQQEKEVDAWIGDDCGVGSEVEAVREDVDDDAGGIADGGGRGGREHSGGDGGGGADGDNDGGGIPQDQEGTCLVDDHDKCNGPFSNGRVDELAQCLHVQSAPPPPPPLPPVYVEMGAGRGSLGLALSLASAREEEVILVERQGVRTKADRALKSLDKKHSRVRIDIRDFNLGQLPAVQGRKMVIIGKHVCGGATDLSLRALATAQTSQPLNGRPPVKRETPTVTDMKPESELPNATSISTSTSTSTSSMAEVFGVAIATCCHHSTHWEDYTGRAFFIDKLKFSSQDFAMMVRLSMWTCCAAKNDRSYADAGADGDDVDGDGYDSEGRNMKARPKRRGGGKKKRARSLAKGTNVTEGNRADFNVADAGAAGSVGDGAAAAAGGGGCVNDADRERGKEELSASAKSNVNSSGTIPNVNGCDPSDVDVDVESKLEVELGAGGVNKTRSPEAVDNDHVDVEDDVAAAAELSRQSQSKRGDLIIAEGGAGKGDEKSNKAEKVVERSGEEEGADDEHAAGGGGGGGGGGGLRTLTPLVMCADALGLSLADRKVVGRRCKRLIDLGRIAFIEEQLGLEAELVHFVHEKVSPENCLILAWPRQVAPPTAAGASSSH